MSSAEATEVKDDAQNLTDHSPGASRMGSRGIDPPHKSDDIVTRQLGSTVLATRIAGKPEVDIKLKDCFANGDLFEFVLKACRSHGSYPRRAYACLSVRLAMSLSPGEPVLHIKQDDAHTWRRFVKIVREALERRVDFDENYTLRIPSKITIVPLVED